MSPFELINTRRYIDSPFSVTCPHCGGPSANYREEESKRYPTQASVAAYDAAGEMASQGTIWGVCRCNNTDCQEFVHFVGSYKTECDESDDPPSYPQKFVIKYFFPAVPLIKIPDATPSAVKDLLVRSFAVAFMDPSACGNLVRSSLEALLTEKRIARFVVLNGKKRRLVLHDRILLLPPSLRSHSDALLAIKWIGNAASHSDLTVDSLRLAFEILGSLLEELYGTWKRELQREIKRVNRRKGP